MTPYDTGKVKIGIRYRAPSQHYMTPEAERIQRLMMGIEREEYRQTRRGSMYVVLLVVGAMLAVALVG